MKEEQDVENYNVIMPIHMWRLNLSIKTHHIRTIQCSRMNNNVKRELWTLRKAAVLASLPCLALIS